MPRFRADTYYISIRQLHHFTFIALWSYVCGILPIGQIIEQISRSIKSDITIIAV